jgi:hypothetical protein
MRAAGKETLVRFSNLCLKSSFYKYFNLFTDYDLNVLRGPPIYEDKLYKDLRQKEAHEVPDIGAFLIDKKDACDKDNDAYPVDDVRHYAYEGDGNSTGSLSSLASCTDDGDLKFNYLSNFGPRFREFLINEINFLMPRLRQKISIRKIG